MSPETTAANSVDGSITCLDDKISPGDLEKAVGSDSDNAADYDEADSPSKPLPHNDPSSFPDGGTKAWLCVAGGAACFFCTFGWTNCMGIFQDYYLQGPLRGYHASTVSWITSCEMFFMLFGGPFVGIVYDNYGPRYLLLLGTFLHVFGLMMASISREYYQFLLSQGVCSAIGASMILNPATTCTATWFYARRGWALGLVAAGSSVGGVLFPVIVSKLIPQIGFDWTMRVCAFIILGLMTFANLTLRSRIPPLKRRFEVAAFFRPFKELAFTLTCLALFAFYWGMFIPFSFIVSDARAHGMSVALAQYLVSICNAASIFGRTLPGYIGDRVGRFNTMLVMCFMTGVFVLALWIPGTSHPALIVFAALFGFFSGAAIGLSPALMAQISDVRDIGVRTGAMFGFSSFAALTASPIGGALVDTAFGHDRYAHTKIWGGVFCILGAAIYALARVRLSGWRFRIKI